MLYRKIKITFYITGLILIVFWYFKYGHISSHSPPLSFIASISMFIIAAVWMNIDYIFSYLMTAYKTRLREHQIFMLIFLLSTIIIFFM